MKRFSALLIALSMLFLALPALGEALPVRTYDFSGRRVVQYESDTLRYDIERFEYEGARCYLTKLWMADPGRQIRKATAVWEESLAIPSEMAKQIPGAALAINGSGYVSPVFPWIPENYPGTNSDYYYTPLGSLTITDGVVFRHLPGVPYYGLTLQSDGLHLHVGDDCEDVLAQQPTQTWSFYVECPMIRDHQSILDTNWDFANRKAIRTIIGKVDDNNYVLLTVTAKISAGLTLVDCVDFLTANVDPEWAYDLDGGPSSALLYRRPGETTLKTVYGNNSKDADAMVFIELPANE